MRAFSPVCPDKGLLHQSFAFEKKVFLIGERLDQNGKSSRSPCAKDVGENLIADDGRLRWRGAEMPAGGKHCPWRRLPASIDNKGGERLAEALYALSAVVRRDSNENSAVKQGTDPCQNLFCRLRYSIGDKGIVDVEYNGADPSGS